MTPIPTPPRLSSVATSPTNVAGGATVGSVHDYARRMAFLTELDSQTWISRYSAAERLGDPAAVTSVARYLAWLRRTGAAWTAVLMPTVAQAEAAWPFASIPASGVHPAGQIEADLRELAMSGGGPHGAAAHQPAAGGSGSTGATAAIGVGGMGASVHELATPHEDIDAAYVTAAAYVAVTMAPEVAVLSADVEHLSVTASRTPLPQRYVRHSVHVASMRGPLRRELAAWADEAGPDAAERVVLAARMLTDQLAEALVSGPRPGW